MQTTFKQVVIKENEVLQALSEFDNHYPDSNSYENWLEKSGYKYALQYGDKLYPPKHILSVITGISTTEFSGGDQTNRIFRQLGFTVIDKP